LPAAPKLAAQSGAKDRQHMRQGATLRRKDNAKSQMNDPDSSV
jgi:hypothetical protein